MTGDAVTELVGVYHADGGPIGEVKYVLGKLLGTAHCALCDVTHSPVRRKPEWDLMVRRLGVPITLLHLNEMPDDVAAAVRTTGSPVVLARLSDGALQVALTPSELDGLGGSVDRAEQAIRAWLAQRAVGHAEP
jgi:hypothetical protein